MKPILNSAELAPHGHHLVLDARDRTAYLAGHFAGAVHLDLKRWEALAKTPEGSLEQEAVWEREIGHLGIDGTRPVAVYDDGRMTEAARAWFILQWHGVDAGVVDGGWPKLSIDAAGTAERTDNVPEVAHFARPAGHTPQVGLMNRHDLLDELDKGLQVLDARTAAEYQGEDLRANARGGHLPGAKSVAHASLLNADGTLKSEAELQARFAQAGLRADQPVVTHCDAGGRAALAALAAVATGHSKVSTYYLSFSDWAADGSCPVV